MSNIVRSKSMEMRGKLDAYISSVNEKEARHVSSSDRLGKRYTGRSTGSFDESVEDGKFHSKSESSLTLLMSQMVWLIPSLKNSTSNNGLKINVPSAHLNVN